MRFVREMLLIVGAAAPLAAQDLHPDTAETAPSPVEVALRKERMTTAALMRDGDPRRGKALYHNERTKCAICHRVGDEGGDVGPDLSQIGGKFDRPHLIESLLEPSRQFVEGFRTSVLELVDGRVLSGIVKEESATHLTLADLQGQRTTIPLSRIAARRRDPASLMPADLATMLDAEQFTDLIAYLESLRPGGQGTPGEGVAGGIVLPEGFRVEIVCTGLSGATALETTPDGRVLVCEQVGRLRVVKDGRLLETPFLTLPVDRHWERGLIGVTVHPDFPRTPFVYACYVAAEPYPHHRVSRFAAAGDVAVKGSERVLLAGDDQRTLGGEVPAGHQGGALHFGQDGKLYVALGEQTAKLPAQSMQSLLGKILRIEPDGRIPEDNPFVAQTEGKYRAIWARGCRNPFTFAVDPVSGLMLINDVGGEFEEINRGVAGANYGWPVVEHGPTGDPRYQGPVFAYPQASISGGDFAAPEANWPPRYRQRYYFADFVHGWIKALDPAQPDRVLTFATGMRRPVDLRFSRDGLYVLLRNAWVIDDKFVGETGSLLLIRHVRHQHDAARSSVR